MVKRLRVGDTDVVKCACKGWLYAKDSPDASTVALSVIVHRETPIHQGWDAEAWIKANTAQVDVPVVVRRVK